MLSINEKHKVWLAVLDGARAQIYDISVRPLKATPRPDGRFEGTKARTRQINTDGPGRSFDSAGQGRHALAPRTDAHDHAEDTFVANVADALTKAASRKAFDKLIVVAPPRAMGILRKKLGKTAERLLEREIIEDWTNIPRTKIVGHLTRHFSPE